MKGVWNVKCSELVRQQAEKARVEAGVRYEEERIASGGFVRVADGSVVAVTDARAAARQYSVDANGRLTVLAQMQPTTSVLVATGNMISDVLIAGTEETTRNSEDSEEGQMTFQETMKNRVKERLNERLASMTMEERANARGLLRLQQEDRLDSYLTQYFENGEAPTTNSEVQSEEKYRVMYLLDAQSVRGNGHAAMIMGSDAEGWYFFSFGSGEFRLGDFLTVNGNMDTDFFLTLNDARTSTKLDRYDQYLSWDISDKSLMRTAFKEASIHLDSSYNLATQNCDDIASRIIRAAGVQIHDEWMPNNTFNYQEGISDETGVWPLSSKQ